MHRGQSSVTSSPSHGGDTAHLQYSHRSQNTRRYYCEPVALLACITAGHVRFVVPECSKAEGLLVLLSVPTMNWILPSNATE